MADDGEGRCDEHIFSRWSCDAACCLANSASAVRESTPARAQLGSLGLYHMLPHSITASMDGGLGVFCCARLMRMAARMRCFRSVPLHPSASPPPPTPPLPRHHLCVPSTSARGASLPEAFAVMHRGELNDTHRK